MKKNPFKDIKLTRASSAKSERSPRMQAIHRFFHSPVLRAMGRFLGIPLLVLGVLLLLYTAISGNTANALLAVGLAFVTIGSIGYFLQLRNRSRF